MMPARTDLESILILGAGPIIIGQACEFDYSGSQAARVYKNLGYRTILFNSNPATIMTDPALADQTYIEPMTVGFLEKILEKEKPDAVLVTVGGQTALNLAMEGQKRGLWDGDTELIGAGIAAIEKSEDRQLFKEAMRGIGAATPESGVVESIQDAFALAEKLKFPLILRPSFTLGGSGGNIVYNAEELEAKAAHALLESPTHQVLMEQSVLGWKEFELEVMRDSADNAVIICSIENVDPMGIHTGDSITVAPAQTLRDKEYQVLRDLSLKILRTIGVTTGGSNVQFSVSPTTGEIKVIEMNPRVSRSSALASKATGFPIAKIAAQLAVGFTLDEIPNDITGSTMAAFEPTIDYVVTKIPRFAFEKFAKEDARLGPQMKSVGEAMSFGRTFQESLQKCIRSLEINRYGLGSDGNNSIDLLIADLTKSKRDEIVKQRITAAREDRIFYVKYAFHLGWTVDEVHRLSSIDPWFLNQIEDLVMKEREGAKALKEKDAAVLREFKRMGYSDRQIAFLCQTCDGGKLNKKDLPEGEREIRKWRYEEKIRPVFKCVDTCSAEFEAQTPYYYSSYEEENEQRALIGRNIIILGGGPNRIGQGIEFDYCCCRASMAIREKGGNAIMVNVNPETVSTDYDISTRLYFEPITMEDILEIVYREKAEGVIIQFGGQTPLKLAEELEREGVKILGTSPDAVDQAEDRERFWKLLKKLKILFPNARTARSREEAIKAADELGFPLLVRPSYVLGGRAMAILYDLEALEKTLREAVEVSDTKPLLLDTFLDGACEVDVDALSDGQDVYVGGIMEHVESAGIHSGDSACFLPSQTLSAVVLKEIEQATRKLAISLKVKGLMNVQFAIKNDDIYCLEVNPRASRTVPFVSKATGIPLVSFATRILLGASLEDFEFPELTRKPFVAVKEAVLPFDKFRTGTWSLGPEMFSTGEVMGHSSDPAIAFAKSQSAAGAALPTQGAVFLSFSDPTKKSVLGIAKEFLAAGLSLYASHGTYNVLRKEKMECKELLKLWEGRPNVVDSLKNGQIQMVVNIPFGKEASRALDVIRAVCAQRKIPHITTLAACRNAVVAIQSLQKHGWGEVHSLQERYLK